MRLILQLCLLVLMLLGAEKRAWGKVATSPQTAVRDWVQDSRLGGGIDAPPRQPTSGEAAAWDDDMASAGYIHRDDTLTMAGPVVVTFRGAAFLMCPGAPPPFIGSFRTTTPAWVAVGPNVYAYVMQNPWTAFDPEGLAAVVYFRKKADYDHATKVQKNSKNGGFYQDAKLILLRKNDLRNVIFDKSTPTKINGVTEGGVKYDKGSFIGTDAAWFFDNTTHAKSITDWFNLGDSLGDVAKGVLANVGNGTAMTASAQVTSKVANETIKEVEKAATKEVAKDFSQMSRAELSKLISSQQRSYLQKLFGNGPEGAKKGLEYLQKGGLCHQGSLAKQ